MDSRGCEPYTNAQKRAGISNPSCRPATASAFSGEAKPLRLNAQAIADRTFDGEWYSNQYGYGFRINDVVGIATSSNNSKFEPGDQILHLDSKSASGFRGRQLFTNGRWYAVTGTLTPEGNLEMTGGNHDWTMVRKEVRGSVTATISLVLPIVSPGACPFEGCQYGRWIASTSVDLYESIDGRPLSRKLGKHEAVQAVSGTIYAMGSKAKVTSMDETDRAQGIKVGDTVYALYPLGEGAVAVWHDGKVKSGSLDLALEYETPLDGQPRNWTWWVKVLLRDGTAAWIKNPTGFDGMDRFG